MRVTDVVNLYAGPEQIHSARQYLMKEGLMDLLESRTSRANSRIPPDYCDLARLHKVIVSRNVTTILELGTGFSTLVMADALSKNLTRMSACRVFKSLDLKNSNSFELHVLDTEQEWLDLVLSEIPKSTRSIVKPSISGVKEGLYSDKECHFYSKFPNVVPDFIYVDGPDPSSVKPDDEVSNSYDISKWSNKGRVVLAADLARAEYSFIPGTLILFDGRASNARFIHRYFTRTWDYSFSTESDTHALELNESPLGSANAAVLRYKLGWDC